MSNAAAKPEPTPGYNCRLQIAFTYDRNGRKVAYRVSRGQMFRNFRMPIADALLFIEQGQADEVPYQKMSG